MPINLNLPDKEFPMEFKWEEEPTTKFLEALNAIKVELIDCPTRKQIMKYIPRYALATWEDHPRHHYNPKQKAAALDDLFNRKLLPTAMETIGFTFLISNIDLVDVTHLIRHRNMSFSAHCTGDRDQRHDECLIKPSIATSQFSDRYKELVEGCKKLYADMVDAEVSILDARTILPRSMTNHYYARVNLRDLIPFFNQRLDRQIQPESDNIIALRMLLEVAKIFPEISNCVDLDRPDEWFIKTAQQDHSSNLYLPEERNDTFEWKPQWFVYPFKRENMIGGWVFKDLWGILVAEYNEIILMGQEE
jgi:thymidylate synthase (FAD)